MAWSTTAYARLAVALLALAVLAGCEPEPATVGRDASGADSGPAPAHDANLAWPDSGQDEADAAGEVSDATPTADAGKPGRDAALPGLDAGDPGLDAGKPGLDAAHLPIDCSQDPSACEDGNGCTVDVCSYAGVCSWSVAPAGTVCRPAEPGGCDLAESCSGGTATCPANAASPAGRACADDGEPCTTDTCDGAGNCLHKPVADQTPCGGTRKCVSGVCTSPTCSASETTCTGGNDEDCDGATDCDDPDCDGASACKCTSDTMQWWNSNPSRARDITFVAFADAHAVAWNAAGTDAKVGCYGNPAAKFDQNDKMIAAINSLGTHKWPLGYGFQREGQFFDHVRGAIMAGDVTQTGGLPTQATTSTSLATCPEIALYRAQFGRCGTEGKLNLPLYEGYGNHDFPFMAAANFTFHPVVDWLDQIGPASRPGAASDIFEDSVAGTGHFAWRWDDIWFVQMDIKPGDVTEEIAKAIGTREVDPHDALRFLKEFLLSRSDTTTRQIVLVSHYGVQSSNFDLPEKNRLCEILEAARTGTSKSSYTNGFAGHQKLAATYPVIANLYGHNHNLPVSGDWTCRNYTAITIRRFEVGSAFYGVNANKIGFTVFRIGNNWLEALGVEADKDHPTGGSVAPWAYPTVHERHGFLDPP